MNNLWFITIQTSQEPLIHITDAVNNTFHQASRTVKNIKWGEMGHVTFRIEKGEMMEYQAEVRIGFEVQRDAE